MKEQERYLAAQKSKKSTTGYGGESSERSEKKRKQDTSSQSYTRGGNRPQSSGRGESRGQGAIVQTSQLCPQCGRTHSGECRRGTRACYRYGEQGHLRRDCPQQDDTGAAVSELTVQYPRQRGTRTTSGRGRGQGQTANSVPVRGRQASQALPQ